MRYARYILTALGLAVIAILLSDPSMRAQVSGLRNYFDQCIPSASTGKCNNVFEQNGKATNTDHATAAMNAAGYSGVITTSLTSVIDCVVTRSGATAPSTGGSVFSALFTTGAATIELTAWQPTSSSVTTLIPASATSTVSWVCYGT